MTPPGRPLPIPPVPRPPRHGSRPDWKRAAGRAGSTLAVLLALLLLLGITGTNGPGARGQAAPDAPLPRQPLAPEQDEFRCMFVDPGPPVPGADESPVAGVTVPPPPPPTPPPPTDDELRSLLAARVKNGRPVPPGAAGSDAPDARTATFRPLRRGEGAEPSPPSPEGTPAVAANSPTPAATPVELVKELGPLEDAALAAAVRGRLAADPELSKLPVIVASQAGRITVRPARPTSSPAGAAAAEWNLDHVAGVLNVALPVEPLVGVTVDLPEAPRRP